MTQGIAVLTIWTCSWCSTGLVAAAEEEEVRQLRIVAGRGPHGGLVRQVDRFQCEVAIQPEGIQLYVWDRKGRPVDVRDVRAGIRLSIKKNPRRQRYDLYPAVNSQEPNRLRLNADLRRIPRFGTRLEVTLHGLVSRTLRFHSPYKYSYSPEQMAIKAQRICPVSGKLLGTNGTPKKVEIADRQVYLCCAACNSALNRSPKEYLAKLPKESR